MSRPIKRILVVGAGWTGRQIAAQSAAFGFPTWLTDASESALQRTHHDALSYTQEQIENSIWTPEHEAALKKNLFIENVSTASKQPVDLVIETVSEQSSIKRKVLKEYSQSFSSETILVSNSSYFLPSQLSRYVHAPERFAHLHFHVPVAYATLVDIVGGPDCDPSVIVRLTEFAQAIGQTPLVQSIENPGYVFNWLLQSLLKSALELLDRKIATPDQIELAWKTVTKMPLGPIGIIDRIGVDVVLQILRNASWNQPDASIERMIHILEPLVEQGKLGWKSGSGFFDYSNDQPSSN